MFAGSFLCLRLLASFTEEVTPEQRDKVGEGLGRDRVLGEWEGDAGRGAQGGEPLDTPGTPGLGGFTERGVGAQVRNETHMSFR